MKSLWKLGSILSVRCSCKSKYFQSKCIYSTKSKENFEKYERIIWNLNLTKYKDSNKVRETNFGSVRLDIDNPNELSNDPSNLDDINPSIENNDTINASDEKVNSDIKLQAVYNCNPDVHAFDNSNFSQNENLDIRKHLIYEVDDPNFEETEYSSHASENISEINECDSVQQDFKIDDSQIMKTTHSFEDSIRDKSLNSEEYLDYYIKHKNFTFLGKTKNISSEKSKLMIDKDVDKKELSDVSIMKNELDEKLNIFKKIEKRRVDRYDQINSNEQNEKILKELGKKMGPLPEPEPVTANDVVKHLRNDDKKPNFRYERILNKLPNYYLKTRYEVLQMLKSSVVFKNDNLVCISKPYGIEMHDGAKSRKERLNIVNLLPELAAHLKVDQLFPVHRLDATTTGVLLLARSQLYATKLKDKFKKGEIQKTYVAITKGCPSPCAGVINLFIGERLVDNRIKMDVKPDIPGFRPKCTKDKKAITKYEVLAFNHNTAVVEIKPLTGVKHQIRVHMGMALKCPILGDHKYSHRDEFAPQRLTGAVLDLLNIKQSRVRDLPMFLHSSSVLIPDVDELKSVRVSASIPPFFTTCLKILRLNKATLRITTRANEVVTDT